MSRRSAAEVADALLEAGRTQPVLHYDVELGLARHHDWLRSEAPMPEWAGAGAGAAASSSAPIVIKTIVSALLVGAFGVAAWQARTRPQPPTAVVARAPAAAARAPAAAPSVRDVTTSDEWMATAPIPVPDQSLPKDEPAASRARSAPAPRRRTVRAAVPDERSAPPRRAHEQPTAAARVEPASAAVTQPHASEDARAERATQRAVAAAPEREPLGAARGAAPRLAPGVRVPDDLAEMQQVATAEQLLERSPERALALVRQGDRRFADGYFQQERAYIAIMALIRLGRIEEARTRAASFSERFPPLPYGARIRRALEAREAAAPVAASPEAAP